MHSRRQRSVPVVESSWFVPAVLLAVAVVPAEVLVATDRSPSGPRRQPEATDPDERDRARVTAATSADRASR